MSRAWAPGLSPLQYVGNKQFPKSKVPEAKARASGGAVGTIAGLSVLRLVLKKVISESLGQPLTFPGSVMFPIYSPSGRHSCANECPPEQAPCQPAPVCTCVPGCGLICRAGWEHTEVSRLPHVQAYLTEKDKHVGMYAQGVQPRRAGSCSCMMLM